MRDSIAHPKLYLIREVFRADFTPSKRLAKPTDWQHRGKALKRKLKRSERTSNLRLPLVPTWISYPDIVVGILVLIRFFNLLEEKYGSYYSMIGKFFARNNPAGFFRGWGEKDRKSITLATWGQAFFDSLTPADQQIVTKRLRAEVSKYTQRRRDPPARPEFLRKARP